MNKTIRTKKHKIIIAAVSAILCAAILISCFYKENEYFTAVSPGIFSEILEENGENIKVVSHFDIPDYSEKCPSFMTNAAFAYPLTKSKGGSFTPFYVSTAVIACDNSKIKTSPSSWSELFYSTEKVAVLSKDLDFCGASLCYALKSENAAIEFLRRLKREDRLVFISDENPNALFENAPLAIMTDSDAAYLIKNGENISFSIPSEGTLSMPVGLYEKNGNIKIPKKDITDAGLRLIDGKCDKSIYPSGYENAVLIEDYGKYGFEAEIFFARFRRDVLGTRHFTTANGFEHFLSYIIFALFVCIWGFSLYIRIADKRFRMLLLLQAVILLFWIFIRFIKLSIYEDSFILWYLYYLPELFSPLIFLYVCKATAPQKRKPSKSNIVLFLITAAFLVLVLTNNIHNFVFVFKGSDVSEWHRNYDYGAGYFAVTAWMSFLIVYGFILLFKRAKSAKSSKIIMAPLIALAILALYIIGYCLGMEIARESELCFIASSFILILWELCLNTGLFGTNIGYMDMFRMTKIPVWLLNADLQVQMHSLCAGSLPEVVKEAVLQGKTHVTPCQTEAFDIMKISGGYAVWKTDLSHICALREKLSEKAEELSEQNAILRLEAETKEEQSVIKHRQSIVSRLKNIISVKIKEIQSLSFGLSEELTAKDKQTLVRIKLLTGFCKRMGMLMLSGEQEDFIKTQALGLLLYEEAVDAAVAQISCSVYYADTGKIKAENAAELYEFFNRCIMLFTEFKETAVFCRLMPEGDKLTLVLIAELPEKQRFEEFAASEKENFKNIEISASFEEKSGIIRVTAGGFSND